MQKPNVGVNVVFYYKEKELMRVDGHAGPLPQAGQRMAFLSGEGVFAVEEISWQAASGDSGGLLLCLIKLRGDND